MSQQRRDAPHDTLEQLESFGDRLVQWVAARPTLVLGVAGAILLTAAGIGGLRAWRHSQADQASAALGKVQAEYVAAMGGQAGDLEAPEPANPETARGVRTDFVQRYLALANEHEGTASAALARLEASELYQALGAPDQALETLQAGVADLASDSPVRAVLLTRLAGLHESRSEFEAAARAFEEAAAVPGYPLRADALADAARTWAEAGNREAALAAYDRLRAQDPQAALAPHVESRLEELRRQP